ncbi:MAG: hypothetical protein WBW33_37800 [Bryobacteraceae bacterium]
MRIRTIKFRSSILFLALAVSLSASASGQVLDLSKDLVSVIIPHSLKGAGEVPVVLTVDGFTANVVSINIK